MRNDFAFQLGERLVNENSGEPIEPSTNSDYEILSERLQISSDFVISPLESQDSIRPIQNNVQLGFSSTSSILTAASNRDLVTETSFADWGPDEGIGTGDLPDDLFSCGCGQCDSCTGGGGSDNFNPNAATNTIINLDQTVFLDFDSGTDGNINYTPDLRADVQAQMEVIYRNFGVNFVQERPEEGDFSTLVFNAGNPGGLAEDIDFRNLNKNDNAVLNVQGLGLVNDQQFVSASAIIGAHELGHIFGLRHHDAFGTIGAGIPDNLFFPGFDPAFPGLMEAFETTDHIMNTPALAGSVNDVLTPSWFGEREAIKLAFAASGTVLTESNAQNDTLETAQEIDLFEIVVPNTIIAGANEDAGDFLVDAVSVIGSFTVVDPVDFYSFQGEVGRAYSFEVISDVTDRFGADPIDATIRIYDEEFNVVDYFGSPAFANNDVEFSRDPHLFDLQLPENGTYYVEVDTNFGNDSGDYELFIQSFVASPFALPEFDDHTDFLDPDLATALQFEPISNNDLARAEGVIGFENNSNERDVFSFTIDSTARVIVDVRASSDFYNAFVGLFDSDNTLIAFNDDNTNPSLENPLDSQFVVPSLPAGDYFVAVRGTNGSTGSYRLGVRHNGVSGVPDDHGDTFVSATGLLLNPQPNTTFVNASAEIGSDRDTFMFTALATGRMVVRSRALNGDLNTVLRSYNEDRELLDSNNNFQGSLDSRLSFDVVAGERYFVRLTTVRETTGDYRLSLRTIEGESNGGGSNGFFVSDPNVDLNFTYDHGPVDYSTAWDELLASSGLDFSRGNSNEVNDLTNGLIAG